MTLAPRPLPSHLFTPGAPPAYLPESSRRDGEWLRLQLSDLMVTALHRAPEDEIRGTVLVAPGYTGSKEDHIYLLAALADRGWDAWSFSHRGQGNSEPARRPDGLPEGNAYTIGDFVGDLLQVVEAVRSQVGAQDQIHLVGHSFGGVVAGAAAVADPASFASLTLMDSGPAGTEGRHEDDRSEQKSRIHARDTGSAALDRRRVIDPRLSAPAADWDRFVEARHLAHSPESLIGMSIVLDHQRDLTEELRDTGLPIHVLHGRHDESWDPSRYAAVAAALDAHFTWIEDAGHNPNREQPEATADALAAFWDGLD